MHDASLSPPTLRPALDEDIPAITRIYAHYVLHDIASFEEIPPDESEMAKRRADLVAARYPYLVATVGQAVVGYGYAGPYRARTAYRFTTEDSIYIDPAHVGRRIGWHLLSRLIDESTARGDRQMIAVIGGGSENRPSVGLHQRLGFTLAGTLHAAGFKHGRWLDSVLMQRPLGEGDATLPVEASR